MWGNFCIFTFIMAKEIKIQGNFFVITDTDSGLEDVRDPKVYTNFKIVTISEGEGSSTNFMFERLYPLRDILTPYPGINFNDIIDERTGLAFNSVDELKEFLSSVLHSKESTEMLCGSSSFSTTESTVIITDQNITSGDKVFLTIEGSPINEVLSVSSVSDGQIEVTRTIIDGSGSLTSDLTFNYLIIK